ncbi:hypothetical protein KR026_009557 [Drosophila bipectinata]|nr:hypothetical protein KR026_009557 [Drosophila bipectinata]
MQFHFKVTDAERDKGAAATSTSGGTNPHTALQPQQPAALVEPKDAQHEIRLQNIVATFSVNCELDLKAINSRTRNSEYSPKRFRGVIMRMHSPRCTALIFRTGKIICTGARNEIDADIGSRKFARILQKLGFPVKFMEYKLQNIVATVDLRFPIRLENLNQVHGQFSSYEPEMFPGLIYRMVKPRIVLLIFVNGKVVFTGAKSRKDIMDCLEAISPILLSFRKT